MFQKLLVQFATLAKTKVFMLESPIDLDLDILILKNLWAQYIVYFCKDDVAYRGIEHKLAE